MASRVAIEFSKKWSLGEAVSEKRWGGWRIAVDCEVIGKGGSGCWEVWTAFLIDVTVREKRSSGRDGGLCWERLAY